MKKIKRNPREEKYLSQSLFLIVIEAILLLIVGLLVFSYRSSPEILSREVDNFFHRVKVGEQSPLEPARSNRQWMDEQSKARKEKAGF